MSWAKSGLTPDLVEELVDDSTVLVLAAGNDGSVHHSEIATIPGVILVAACDSTGAFYTDYSGGPNVDICAPGRDITHLSYYTSQPTWHNLYGIKSGNGSSFSVAFVSGTIALMRAVNPKLTPLEIETILHDTSHELANPDCFGPEQKVGYLNACAAVQAAIGKGVLKEEGCTWLLPYQEVCASSVLRLGNYADDEFYWEDNGDGVMALRGHTVLKANYAVELYEGFSVQEDAELDIVILE